MPGPVYFGNASQSTSHATSANETDTATYQNTAGDGIITTGRIWLSGGAGAASVRFVVYSNPGGVDTDPSLAGGPTLLGYSDTVALGAGAAGAFVDFPFSTPVAVLLNAWYYIGIQTNAAINVGCGGTGNYYNVPDTFSDGPAATLGGGGSRSGAGDLLSVQAGVGPAAPPAGGQDLALMLAIAHAL